MHRKFFHLARACDSNLIRRGLRFAALLSLLLAGPATARVLVSFHSVNGSVFGRYPHAFVELTGTLDESGRSVQENYGYTAVSVTPAILAGNVRGTIEVERQEYIRTTNLHFRAPITDQQYYEILAEVARWRDSPTEDYNLNHNNCVSFVARIARLAGLAVNVPQPLIKRPKAWLNYIAGMNPQLHAAALR